jgi:hypothetical protein
MRIDLYNIVYMMLNTHSLDSIFIVWWDQWVARTEPEEGKSRVIRILVPLPHQLVPRSTVIGRSNEPIA